MGQWVAFAGSLLRPSVSGDALTCNASGGLIRAAERYVARSIYLLLTLIFSTQPGWSLSTYMIPALLLAPAFGTTAICPGRGSLQRACCRRRWRAAHCDGLRGGSAHARRLPIPPLARVLAAVLYSTCLPSVLYRQPACACWFLRLNMPVLEQAAGTSPY